MWPPSVGNYHQRVPQPGAEADPGPFFSALKAAAATLRTLRLSDHPNLEADSMQLLVETAPALSHLELLYCKLHDGALLPLLDLQQLEALLIARCTFEGDEVVQVVGFGALVRRPLLLLMLGSGYEEVRQQLVGMPLVKVVAAYSRYR